MGIASLNAALAGLRMSQAQIAMISNNVSNVSTPGYSRKILPQYAQSINGQTVGVLGGTVLRNVDMNLTRDLWTQVSSQGGLEVRQKYLDRVGQFHGPPDAERSIAAELSRLYDSFSVLSDSPEDTFLRASVVNQARNTAQKINDFSKFITTARNDVQNEMITTVDRINNLLIQIKELNDQVASRLNVGDSTAQLEDYRDIAVQELSELIGVTFFTRGDGKMVVQTTEGVELTGESYTLLTFDASPLSATNYYPDSAAAVYVGEVGVPGTVDITGASPGGKLGGLIELRDVTFPKQMAQLDELAHKLALRLKAQGLTLFTDRAGSVPLDTPPDLSPLTAVPYVGFSREIQVNPDILADHSLLQSGTYGASIPPSSNEVIRRVLEFGFGSIDYQLIANLTVATSVDLLNTGGDDLQEWLGLYAENRITSNTNLEDYASIADLLTAGGTGVFGSGGSQTDTFDITFDDPDFGGGPYVVSIDLSAVAVGGVSAAQDLIDTITADADWANIVADFDAAVSIDSSGRLVITSRGNVDIAAAGASPLSDAGFQLLGLVPDSYEATDPYFDIAVGNNELTRVSIEPGDTRVELLAKLNAIDGVVAQLDASGFLEIRPGNDFTNPDFGGDITIIGGPFETDSASLSAPPSLAGRTSIADGVGVVSALFGTYTDLGGGVIQNESPVNDTEYQSETYQGSGVYVSFRQEYLGPYADISTLILGSTRLVDFGQKMVNEQSQELISVQNLKDDGDVLKEALQTQLQNDSGVNLDEELSNMIVQQNAYAAAARVIAVVDQTFQDLLDAFRR